MNMKSFDLIPSFFSFNTLIKPVNLAFSIIQSDYFNFSSTYSSRGDVTKIEGTSKSYLIGPAIALKISDSFAIGTSVFYLFSTHKSSLFYSGQLMET